MGVFVRWYIDIITIIINFPYSTCISSFLAVASLLLCSFKKCFFGLFKNKNKQPKWLFFTSRGAHLNCAIFWRCYTLILLEIIRRIRWWCLKCVIVYPARDIPPFVMYCVNGKPRSSLLKESTDSMILILILQWTYRDSVFIF